MKRRLLALYLLLLPLLLHSVTSTEKYWEEHPFTNTPKGWGIHTDFGYSSYLIELHSSEMDAAIDYDVLEATLGLSYLYDRWLWGIYGTFLLDEVKSNTYVVTTKASLNDRATIDKNEFALYLNYRFFEGEDSSWGVNTIYRYAHLHAIDAYGKFYHYRSHFSYQTEGVACSLGYRKKLFERGALVTHLGVLYSRAGVKVSESVNGHPQDSFVDDGLNTLGRKVSFAYQHHYTKNLSLHLRTDFWKQKFNHLNVTSHVGDLLPSATLKEESYSTYLGMAWRF